MILYLYSSICVIQGTGKGDNAKLLLLYVIRSHWVELYVFLYFDCTCGYEYVIQAQMPFNQVSPFAIMEPVFLVRAAQLCLGSNG